MVLHFHFDPTGPRSRMSKKLLLLAIVLCQSFRPFEARLRSWKRGRGGGPRGDDASSNLKTNASLSVQEREKKSKSF